MCVVYNNVCNLALGLSRSRFVSLSVSLVLGLSRSIWVCVSRSEALSLFRSGFVSLWVCLALIQSETKSKRDKHTNPERNKNCRNGVRGSGGNPVLLGLGGGSAVVRLGPTRTILSPSRTTLPPTRQC